MGNSTTKSTETDLQGSFELFRVFNNPRGLTWEGLELVQHKQFLIYIFTSFVSPGKQ